MKFLLCFRFEQWNDLMLNSYNLILWRKLDAIKAYKVVKDYSFLENQLICWLSYVGRLFAVVDDIFCLFQGHLENVANLKQQYGLNKTATEVIIIIEAYRTLRDRGPYPAAQVVRDFQGKFAFILYDSGSKTAFVAAVSYSLFKISMSYLWMVFFSNLAYISWSFTGCWWECSLCLGNWCWWKSRFLRWDRDRN